MSIKIAGTDISRVYKGTDLVNKIYVGNKLIFNNAIYTYASIVYSLGGNGQDAIDLYNTIPNDVRSNAKVILMPFTIASGVVYAMDNVTGELIPFNFSRASSATLFNKNKDMELVGNNIPRIDYGNYTGDVKLLVEKESTNLIVDSALATNTQSVYHPSVSLVNINWFDYIKTGRSIPHVANTDIYAYKQSAITNTLNYAMSSFVLMNDGSIPNFRFNENTVNGAILIDAYPFALNASNLLIKDNIYRVYGYKSATRTITGNNGIVKYRNNYGGTINASGYQLEQSDTATSYIPTTTTTATRAADHLTYTLSQNSSVYLKTNKRETTFSKNVGLWNIHEDLNNEGIQILAII
ncbi:hypothetical protein [Dysgonomonas sp.]|uniref:phage head spike fiber domain-containing protein n=1 Tax=Dysgonomonas sp. TaxID=1891233 RepID=UPI0027B8F660|nr:hypothetical protein [Dysgonomonas sp.]